MRGRVGWAWLWEVGAPVGAVLTDMPTTPHYKVLQIPGRHAWSVKVVVVVVVVVFLLTSK